MTKNDTLARDTERRLDRVVSGSDSLPKAAVSVTVWDDGRGEEFIEAVEEAMQEVYDV